MVEASWREVGGRRALLILFAVAVGAFIVWRVGIRALPVSRLLVEAQEALDQRDHQAAADYAGEVLRRDSQHADALLIAAEAASAMGKPELAIEYCDRIPDDGSEHVIRALCLAGDVYFRQLYELSEAEKRYREARERAPNDIGANEGLASLLSSCGRNREAIPCLLVLARQEKISADQLLQINFLEQTDSGEEDVDFLKQCQEAAPEDPLPLIGLAQAALRKKQTTEASSLLRRALAIDPDQATAHILLGRTVLAGDSAEDYSAWRSSLPPSAVESADVWALRGQWADRNLDKQLAIQCFYEALRRNPDHPEALETFPKLLESEGFRDAADAPRKRLNRQEQVDTLLRSVIDEKGDLVLSQVREAAETLQSMGRVLEANGWAVALLKQFPRNLWAQRTHEELRSLLDEAEAKTLAKFNPVRDLDFSEGSSIWNEAASSLAAQVAPRSVDAARASIAFEEIAQQVGIDFTYFNGAPPDEQTYRMLEITGGGVAILDFDADGWPDIYLTQGSHWPTNSGDGSAYRDRLYRNIGGHHFEDVTEQAGLGDENFSQGVTVGDFDNDGFQDVYLANIGRNRLYRNQGDGTFADVSAEASQIDEQWTTSCLMADLNGDSLPDLYAVNYVEGPDVFDKICRTPVGDPASCLPLAFEGAQDRIYINSGDGAFQDQTETAGIIASDGNGLGIVAADFQGNGSLSLFVANDQTPNFMFSNQTSPERRQVEFSETAMLAGVAVNQEGRSQACMGVACGDVDGNGRLDLHITNFTGEYNTLYLQQSAALFLDATRPAGLEEPSRPYLGFGTQFLDGDLDGWLDIIVANGAIDDSGKEGSMYEMEPKFYQNRGGAKFEELDAKELGQFFETPRLGRGLALIDWNRDGLQDAAISHLHDHAALLENQTTGGGHYLALRLRGVASEREAIGTTVTVKTGDTTRVRQLTAGDGYQASNERKIVIGLADQASVDKVHLRWPSGLEQTFENVPADQTYLATEGHSQLLTMPIQGRIE